MRIRTVAADGFGQLHGMRLAPAAGLTVVHGPNEAGKTTLLAFIRAILFGFEIDRHPALSGGRRGGWLDVEMLDGRQFRIERYGEKGGAGTTRVLDEYDTNLGEGYLATLLQGVERKVYRNIFAFGLEELTQLGSLTDSEVAARIYGAGLGTGSVSGLDVENALRTEREALFKPGGQIPTINGLLRSLEESDELLRGRDLPHEYGEAGVRLARVERRLVDVIDQHVRLSAGRRGRQRVIEAWATWLDLLAARADRDDLGSVRAFAAPTLEHLGRLETAVATADEAAQQAGLALARAEAGLEAAALDEAALARRPELEAMIEASRVEAARRDERARTERELAAAATKVGAAVAQLGPGWSVARIDAFDDSIAVHAEIAGRFRTLLDRSTQAAAGAGRDLAAVDERRAEVAAQAEATDARIAELDGELGARPPFATRERTLREIEALGQRLGALREAAADNPDSDLGAARAAVERRSLNAGELRAAQESERSVRELLAGVGAGAQVAAAGGPAWRALLAPAALGVIGVTVAVVLAISSTPLAAAVVAAMALIAAAAWVVIARRQPGSSAPDGFRRQLEMQLERASAAVAGHASALGLGASPAPDDVARLVAALEEERRGLDREADRRERAEAAGRDAVGVERQLAAVAATMALPPEPSIEARDAIGRQVAADRDLDARRAGLREQLAQLRGTADSLARRREELVAALDQRAAEAGQARGDWERWLEAHDLDPALDRETAGRVVEAITSAKTAIATMRALEARRDDLGAAHAAFVAQVTALAPLLPGGRYDPADLTGATALLERRLETALSGERARAALERERSDRAAGHDEAQRALARAHGALDGFLADRDVPDAEILRAEIERSARAAALDERIAAATGILSALSGPGDALTMLKEDLAGVADVDAVRVEVEALDDQVAQLATERDELNQEAGALRNRRAEMEQDAAATDLRQRHADLQAQLGAVSERWTVLALAHEMLARSRAAYEEAHRPAVVQAAERHLAAWTDGRYGRIIAPLGRPIEGVEREDGFRVPLVGLSRGTSEQLYLAMRFGLVEHFVETSKEPLPIVMDDILVNFDADRAERAARSIEQLSRTCQVIYFTCHLTTPLRPDLVRTLAPPG